MAAVEGEIVTAIADQWRKLPEGQARSVDASAANGKQRAILPAPAFTAVPSLSLVPSDGSGSIEFGWTAVPQAVSYAVTVTGTGAAIRELEVASPKAAIGGLGPGRYQLSVTAVDRYGLGGKSKSTGTRVLGVELPAGASQVGDAIEIGRRQRIHLTDPEGLEVTYGSAEVFVPAPSDIGLAGGMPTLLRLRASGEQAELSLRLLPAKVRAGISIVTGSPGWPREPGKLRISFRDSQGRLLASAPNANIEVRVNRLPVRMSWVQRGGILEGTLAARGGWGPFSIGVRVTDKLGEEIGRDVLNIGGAELADGTK
jgi:hypothetical protein